MKGVLFGAIGLIFATVVSAQTDVDIDADSQLNWYQEQYPFMSMDDTVYTLETEFVLPEGYARPEPSELTDYQSWVAHFPLWHQYKPVGEWTGRKAFEKEEISRAVHIPWRGREYTDLGFTLRLAAEYLRSRHREFDLIVVPRAGDTLTYKQWLTSKPARTGTGAVVLKPATPRDTSAMEYYRYLATGMRNVDYSFFADNGDTVAPEKVRPGDFLVGMGENPRDGKVYIVLNMLVNEAGEKLYTVATGCKDACDFHIPLLTDDRNRPWIMEPEMMQLVEDFPNRAYYRLDILR